MTTIEAVRLQAAPGPPEILSLQREAFLRAGPPTLRERKAGIKKLMEAVKADARRSRPRFRPISATGRGTKHCSPMSGRCSPPPATHSGISHSG